MQPAVDQAFAIAAQAPNICEFDTFRDFCETHAEFHDVAHDLLNSLIEKDIELASALRLRIQALNDEIIRCIDALVFSLRESSLLHDEPLKLGSQKLWDVSFEIGINGIDRQHRTIATLIELALPDQGSTLLGIGSKELITLLIMLIRREIKAETAMIAKMAANGIESAKAHEEAHHTALFYLSSVESDLSDNKLDLTEAGLYLGRWYIDHLIIHDQELA